MTNSRYTNRARLSKAAMAALIVSDSPSTVTRRREVQTDTFRGKTTQTAGPFTVRLEPFRHTKVAPTFDEKGGASTHSYVLLALYNSDPLAGELLDGTTFKRDDTVVRGSQTYRVTSVNPDDSAGTVEVNLELEQ